MGIFFSFFSLIYLVSCVLLITVWVWFSQFEENFFCDLVDDLIYAIDLEFFSLIYAYAYTLKVWTRFELFMVFHIPYVLFSWFNFFFYCMPLSRFSTLLLSHDSLSFSWFILLVRISFEFSGWVFWVLNSIFISAYVFFNLSLIYCILFSSFGLLLLLLPTLCLCFLWHLCVYSL